MLLGEIPPETRTFQCGHQETHGGSYWLVYSATGDFSKCVVCRTAEAGQRLIDHNAVSFAKLRSLGVQRAG